jgi:hypothetical protein
VRRHRWIVGVLVTAFVLAVAILEVRSPFERVWDELFFLIAGEETRFAPGYSDDAFGSVHMGDTEARVRELLGSGVWEYPEQAGEPKTAIHYSDSPGSTHFRRRFVAFENGKVTEIIADLYVD